MHCHSHACNCPCFVTLMHVSVHALSLSCMYLSMRSHTHAHGCPCTFTLVHATVSSCMRLSMCSHAHACHIPCAVTLTHVPIRAQLHLRMQSSVHSHTHARSYSCIITHSCFMWWTVLDTHDHNYDCRIFNNLLFPSCQYALVIPCRAVRLTTKESLI